MLLMLREAGIRDQCFFTFSGQFYGIKLWGGVLQSSLKKPLYRPHWLALATANRGIFGDLIETKHSGSAPNFTVPNLGKKKRGEPAGPRAVDSLWSYAFKEKGKRSVIIANIDVAKDFPVTIKFNGNVNGKVLSYQVVGGTHLSNNEPEHEPQVFLKESEVTGFKSGYSMTLPAASITTITWNEK
jgi:hypothetical protein